MAFTQLYKSTDQNAPPLSGQAGSLIVLLNAVLKDGYGHSGISITITRSGSTATATVSAADGLKLKTGMWVRISGADQTEYNGTFQITVTAATTFTYTVSGTPATPATGTIVGSTIASVTSITRADNTATVTLPQADATLVTGQYVTIAGANESDYNGTFQITVTDSTHFTYPVANSPATPATGTITCRKAPLGWGSPFTGTNQAVYRSPTGTRHFLRVIDNAATTGGAKEAQAIGYVDMTAFDTGTELFPTAAQLANGDCWRKSNTADTVQRAWTLVGDDKTFYLLMSDSGTVATTNSCGFGEFTSYKAGDAYNTFIAGGSAFNTANPSGGICYGYTLATMTAYAGFYAPRTYTQLGTAVQATLLNPTGVAAVLGSSTGGMTYPNGPDSGLYVGPVMVGDSGVRGRMRGLFAPLHSSPLTHYDIATGVVGLSGITLTCLQTHNGGTVGEVFVDTFGAW